MDSQVANETIEETTELPVLETGEMDAYCWRLEQLTHAGYSGELAYILAENKDVDLHVACSLLVRGCSEQNAYAILL